MTYLVSGISEDTIEKMTARVNYIAKQGWRLVAVVGAFHYFEKEG